VVEHNCNPSTREAEAEFKVSLGYKQDGLKKNWSNRE
jgi:hypothetical protein